MTTIKHVETKIMKEVQNMEFKFDETILWEDKK